MAKMTPKITENGQDEAQDGQDEAQDNHKEAHDGQDEAQSEEALRVLCWDNLILF